MHRDVFTPCCPPAENEQRSNILRLRRRFLKDQEKVSLGFAQKEIQQQRQRKVRPRSKLPDGQTSICLCLLFALMSAGFLPQEEKADQRLRKEAQVTLYRNYRVGDFPDIQIPYSSLIAPLQALAQARLILQQKIW